MKTSSLIEKAVIKALFGYMGKHGLHQIELAKILGWSPSDLNDTLKGRKGIGKHRQAYLEEKLGNSFKSELVLEINGLSESGGENTLTNAEQEYVDKLLAIFRGLNQQAKLALQININVLYSLSQKKQEISKKDIRLMLEELMS